MDHNNRKIITFLIALTAITAIQLISYSWKPTHLQTYCEYGYLQKTSQDIVGLDCMACYNFDEFSQESGLIELSNSFKKGDVIGVEGVLLYQNECTLYECKYLQKDSDLQFGSSVEAQKLYNMGFKEKIRITVQDNFENQQNIKVQQNSKRYSFVVRYLIKLNPLVKLQDIVKPDFVIYSAKNSVFEKMLLSALGLIALGEINLIFLFAFLDWKISFLLSAWATYNLLQTDYHVWFARIVASIWAVGMLFPQYIHFTYTFLNCAIIILVFSGKTPKTRGSYIHLNFLLSFVLLAYMGNLDWLMLSIPQLLYFLHSIGPCDLLCDMERTSSRPLEPYFIEEDDIELKIRKQLDGQ